MSENEQIALMIRGLISQMSDEQKAKIAEVYSRIKAIAEESEESKIAVSLYAVDMSVED